MAEMRHRCQHTGPRSPNDPKAGEGTSIEESVLPARRGVRTQLGRSPEVLNGLGWVLKTVCSWRHLVKGCPSKCALGRFRLSPRYRTPERSHDPLCAALREAV